MVIAAQFLSAFSTLIFAGAAIYINLVEHPARMGCTTSTAFSVWAPSYKRATLMQAPLAILGSATGLLAWLLGAGWVWLWAAALIFLVVPFTFIVIMPTNKQLLAPGINPESEHMRQLLQKWGSLHAVRSALSLIASVLMLGQLVGS